MWGLAGMVALRQRTEIGGLVRRVGAVWRALVLLLTSASELVWTMIVARGAGWATP